jgi:hypothetical protein
MKALILSLRRIWREADMHVGASFGAPREIPPIFAPSRLTTEVVQDDASAGDCSN